MLGDRRDRGRQPHQPRPDVALRRGHQELGPDLAAARDPDPARPVVAVAGRARAPGCRCRCFPGFDTLGTLEAAAGQRPRPLLVRADPGDHREGVRALRPGAEPRPDRQERPRAAAPAALQGRDRTRSRRSRSTGEDFVVARHPREPGRRHERADRRGACSTPRTSAARSRRATASSTTPSPRTCRSTAMRQARSYRGDRLIRVATPHKILDPAKGPLIAVRLHVLTRKSLGGLETDLDARVLRPRRRSAARAVRRRRGGRVRRRRRARLQLAGGHVPGRLHLLRTRGRTGAGAGGGLTRGCRRRTHPPNIVEWR